MPRAFLVRKKRTAPTHTWTQDTEDMAPETSTKQNCVEQEEQEEQKDAEPTLHTRKEEDEKEEEEDDAADERRRKQENEDMLMEEEEEEEEAEEEKRESSSGVGCPLSWRTLQALKPSGSSSSSSASVSDDRQQKLHPSPDPITAPPQEPTPFLPAAKASPPPPRPVLSTRFPDPVPSPTPLASRPAEDPQTTAGHLSSFPVLSPGSSVPSPAGIVLSTQVPRTVTSESSPGLLNVQPVGGEGSPGEASFQNVFPSAFPNHGQGDGPSTKHPFPIPPSSLPLSSAREGSCFYASPQHVFSFPPGIVRPIPSSGLPWPIQPIPLRVPVGLRPSFGLCGVTSPEEVPSPPGSSVADMPGSPILGMKSGMGPLRACGFMGDMEIGVDLNNNNSNNSNRNPGSVSGVGVGGVGGCGSGELLAGNSRRQNFKEFLESAKVRVETINDGNGLKNPLLSSDTSRLALDSGALSFMTLDSFPSCPVCGMKCDTPRLLQRHVRSHKEIKRYLCAWCGKGFNDTFDLKRHTRTHTGVRPYKCESCGKAFTQRCSLESHCRKIHGQNLPFTFNERRTKLYVCEECGHSTPNIDVHFEHLRAQHPGHPALERPQHDRRQFKFGGDGDCVDDVDVDGCSGDGVDDEGREGGRGGEGKEVMEAREQQKRERAF
ncbi:uncharacterized protein LOC143283828 [Babylonia areolata]|uniref:uncharacterized protein LOC143283828 n=1 Tax=Babylonia areolata TaxID=304850 RepID=UPI003FD13E56